MGIIFSQRKREREIEMTCTGWEKSGIMGLGAKRKEFPTSKVHGPTFLSRRATDRLAREIASLVARPKRERVCVCPCHFCIEVFQLCLPLLLLLLLPELRKQKTKQVGKCERTTLRVIPRKELGRKRLDPSVRWSVGPLRSVFVLRSPEFRSGLDVEVSVSTLFQSLRTEEEARLSFCEN